MSNSLRGEDSYRYNVEERAEEDMLQDALIYKSVDDLTYRAYRWQRTFYGIAAERLAPHFPRADKYEAMLQDELRRAA